MCWIDCFCTSRFPQNWFHVKLNDRKILQISTLCFEIKVLAKHVQVTSTLRLTWRHRTASFADDENRRNHQSSRVVEAACVYGLFTKRTNTERPILATTAVVILVDSNLYTMLQKLSKGEVKAWLCWNLMIYCHLDFTWNAILVNSNGSKMSFLAISETWKLLKLTKNQNSKI